MPNFKIVDKKDIPQFNRKPKLRLTPEERFNKLSKRINRDKTNRKHQYKVVEYPVINTKQIKIYIYGLFNGYGQCVCEVFKTEDYVKDFRFLWTVASNLYNFHEYKKHKGGYWFN
jgi:hypothetical protein